VKPLLIFGTGGMARETADIASALGMESAFIARDAAERDSWTRSEQVILESEIGSQADASFAVGIGDGRTRQRIAERYKDLHFPALIHPFATFGIGQQELVSARRGVIVCAGVRFTCDIAVGDFCIFNLNSTVSHDCVIEDFVTLAPGATVAGNVHLGARSWVGAGSVVNQGAPGKWLRIGDDTVIGSGAVVTGDCEAGRTYVGIPAKARP